ncbi:septin-2-like [Sarcophilus harrisii]
MSQSGDKKLPSETAGYVGFANLPNQVHRKSVKKGFEFTLMVVGESGLGKSTLINSLFLTDLYPERYIPGAAEKIERTVEIEASTVEIEERGVKLRLTVVDTPGYGDAINSQDCFKTIIYYIDNQFERYLHDESGLNRRHIVDNRVHCCFYFISPFGHGLKPLDVEFMRALHSKVNIVPVIAKADTLTLKERERLKHRILDEISEHGIRIYHLPDADSDEDEEFKEQTRDLKASIPFAVIGSNQLIEVKGKKIRGRLYPWGVVEVENPEHNDFLKLRTMLVTHMQDLQEVTQDLHYENFRSERLKRSGGPDGEEVVDKDRILQQKEAEVRMLQPTCSPPTPGSGDVARLKGNKAVSRSAFSRMGIVINSAERRLQAWAGPWDPLSPSARRPRGAAAGPRRVLLVNEHLKGVAPVSGPRVDPGMGTHNLLEGVQVMPPQTFPSCALGAGGPRR